MNRRKFLSWLGVGVVGAAVAPTALLSPGPACVAVDPLLGVAVPCDAVIGSYAEYCSFSSLAIATAIDDLVANAAKELGEAAGRDIAALQAQAFA